MRGMKNRMRKMKGEIDSNFYCPLFMMGHCTHKKVISCNICYYKRRKYPTTEQYLEEYGKEYPDDGAVYALISHGAGDWEAMPHGIAKERIEDVRQLALTSTWEYGIVCACTPWAKPPQNWRPE
jgi:hypothetical protein